MKKKPCKLKSRMGTHSSKAQGKWKHKLTQPKEKQKQTMNKNQVKILCKEDSWLQNDNQQ